MRRIVQVSTMNWCGFGNQLFRYAFARAYAEKHGAVLETSPWIGQQLFHLNDPPLSCRLPRTQMDQVPWGEVNIDLYGFFQFTPAVALYSQKKAKEWFKFRPEILARYPRREGHYVAVHVRRGDYPQFPRNVCVVSEASYAHLLNRLGIPPEKLVRVTDGTSVIREYPTADSFLEDFLTLMRARVIIRANSTFSWWAATLSDAETVYSPLVYDKLGWQDVEFVEGNWPRMVDSRHTQARLTDVWLSKD